MNKRNLNRLINRIKQCEWVDHRKLPDNKRSFNMVVRAFRCGSPGCVAGHCGDLMNEPPWSGPARIKWFLGVDYNEALKIFDGAFSDKHMEDITPEDTIDYLKQLGGIH